MVYNGLGLIFLIKKDFNKAIENFEKCIEYDDNEFTAYINLGNCYKQLENFDKAIEYYEKATTSPTKKHEALTILELFTVLTIMTL